MDSENTPDITAVGTSFFSETGRNTSVALRKLIGVKPFFHVHGRDGLL
jgi:hypothetical protein